MGAWLCASSKNAATSDRTLLGSSSPESVRATAIHKPGSSGTSTGITNSVRKNETTNDQTYAMFESTPSVQLPSTKTITISTNEKKEGEDIMQQQQQTGISLAESQFYARTSNIPDLKQHDFVNRISDEIHSSPPIEDFSLNKDQVMSNKNTPIKTYEEDKPIQNQELYILEPIDVNSSSSIRPIRPLSNTIMINPFERLRPMGIPNDQPPSSEELSLQIFDRTYFPPKQNEIQHEISPEITTLVRPLKASIEQMQDVFDDNDSSTSTATNRSIHLPVEKQRGLSEIIRKRNSRYKVEDYKRSYQKPNTFDEQQQQYNQTLPVSKSDHDLTILSNNSTSSPSDITSKHFNRVDPVEIPIDISDKRAQMSIERLNLLLSSKDENLEQQEIVNEIDENMSVADKRNLFETISKDVQFGGTLPRSKSMKQDDTSFTVPITKKYANGNQRSQTENIVTSHQINENSPEKKTDNDGFDDDTSKLTFKEKMTLFDKKKNIGLAPSSSLKNNRNRLTQPVTAEEVQAAVNLTPGSSSKQLATTSPVTDEYHMRDNCLSLSEKYLFSTESILHPNHLTNLHVRYISAFICNIDDATMSNPEESDNVIKKLEQIKTSGETEWKSRIKTPTEIIEFNIDGKPQQTSVSIIQKEKNLPTPIDHQKQVTNNTRKTTTLKYNAKKTNTDQEQRAKTVDIVRLKTGK